MLKSAKKLLKFAKKFLAFPPCSSSVTLHYLLFVSSLHPLLSIGHRVLVIPASLAYGTRGSGDGRIPSNSCLVFYLSAGRVKINATTTTSTPLAANPPVDATQSRRSSTMSTQMSNGLYSSDLPTSFTLPAPADDASTSPSPSPSDHSASSFLRRESASSSFVEEEEEQSGSKKSLMSRMAKMGQAILPPPPVAAAEPSTPASAAAPSKDPHPPHPDVVDPSVPWVTNGGHPMNGAAAAPGVTKSAPIHSSVLIKTMTTPGRFFFAERPLIGR